MVFRLRGNLTVNAREHRIHLKFTLDAKPAVITKKSSGRSMTVNGGGTAESFGYSSRIATISCS
jgi:hypothetical protein